MCSTLRYVSSTKPRKFFPSYHIPATPAVSCDYALFCATAPRYPPYSQWLPHSFALNGNFFFRQPFSCVHSFSLRHSAPSLEFPVTCSLLCISKKVKSFGIKQIRPLFAKHPGWGWVLRIVPGCLFDLQLSTLNPPRVPILSRPSDASLASRMYLRDVPIFRPSGLPTVPKRSNIQANIDVHKA